MLRMMFLPLEPEEQYEKGEEVHVSRELSLEFPIAVSYKKENYNQHVNCFVEQQEFR